MKKLIFSTIAFGFLAITTMSLTPEVNEKHQSISNPDQIENMKHDIMGVVRQYLSINEEEADFRLDHVDEHIALVTSLPVAKIRENNG